MSDLVQKRLNRTLRKNRIRASVSGTAVRPRLSVFISSTNVSAQVINDDTHQTLVAVTTIGAKNLKGTLTEKAAWVGSEIAVKAKAAKIKAVVFDRNGRAYHGRVKALADAAREKGLEV